MKKTKKIDPFAPLDKYEEELIKSIENDEWVEIPNQKEEIEKLVGAAKYTREMMKKEKRITVRVNKQDLEDIQEKAIQTGIPYQTLIASILHKFAKGKINIGV
ncbi:hypothetical protein A2767_01965 [Candidatus Roizmanbacteria bacterium RIFCSPHIGHO2_01_FULL_35_10]|uniref:Antitoxin n=1 Tax=Candidatus Roizmanbacteria bacterium RIFCSPLOWO2_01_FULL_35_13 TaxID=1802055 RepID=A0A1F7I772_9BACT|nr:MAG: hypothetical protein A2767_01965 [Candidatus Roizmanbacteria bacterium RIFCSPHIGHO2_01_FULL_35_10]OGK39228.1 MAG: hypothetical protein A3A74_07385 [Candidatus Roizmanbacteria bacterium RIFCSPLOWO2_01_FULL_35_13]